MTEKVFYIDPYMYELGTKVTDVVEKDSLLGLSFDETIFFPEGGGQPCDRGIIRGDGWKLDVFKVEENDKIWHWGRFEGRKPNKQESVVMKIDIDLRREYAQQHTAQHLFSAILERDYALKTTGFQILEEYTKIEVPLKDELPIQLIDEAEKKTNFYILQGIPIKIYWKDKITRIIEIPGLDVNPCGGLHVRDTSELGLFKILEVYKKNSRFTRIEFIAGDRILKRLSKREKEYQLLKEMVGDPDVISSVGRLLGKIEELEKENKNLNRTLIEYQAEGLIKEAIDTNLGKILIKGLDYDIDKLSFISRKISSKIDLCLFSNPSGQIVISRSVNIPDEIWQSIIEVLGRNGWRGGKGETFIQGKVVELEDTLISINRTLDING
ncbi:MAG: alanyl-tRNA editing protein [bacterium]